MSHMVLGHLELWLEGPPTLVYYELLLYYE